MTSQDYDTERQTQRKTPSKEDDLTGRQPYRKTTSQDNALIGRQPHRKRTSLEDKIKKENLLLKQPDKKITSVRQPVCPVSKSGTG